MALNVARVWSIPTRLLVTPSWDPLLLFVYYFQVNTGGVLALLFWIKLKFICLVAPSDPPQNLILHYTILYYTMLCYPILSYPILSYPILCYPILSYTGIMLSYTKLCYAILYYTILYYTVLYYGILSYTVTQTLYLYPLLLQYRYALLLPLLLNFYTINKCYL